MRLVELFEGLSHPVIVVDVQPEYSGVSDGADDSLFVEIIEFVNKQTGPVLMYVNAEQSGVSGDSINSIKQYWEESLVPEEQRYIYDNEADEYIENPDAPAIDWNRFQFFDKGFGYFRVYMDAGVSERAIIKLIRRLHELKLTDSRELPKGELEQLLGYDYQPWMESDPLIVNWLSLGVLKQFNGAYLVGGGRNECLREVELYMNAFNIKYKRIDSLVYG